MSEPVLKVVETNSREALRRAIAERNACSEAEARSREALDRAQAHSARTEQTLCDAQAAREAAEARIADAHVIAFRTGAALDVSSDLEPVIAAEAKAAADHRAAVGARSTLKSEHDKAAAELQEAEANVRDAALLVLDQQTAELTVEIADLEHALMDKLLLLDGRDWLRVDGALARLPAQATHVLRHWSGFLSTPSQLPPAERLARQQERRSRWSSYLAGLMADADARFSE